MSTLDEVIVDLVRRLPTELDARARAHMAIVVDDLHVQMPIEARIVEGAQLWTSSPRSRMATGFMAPHVTLRARFVVDESDEVDHGS